MGRWDYYDYTPSVPRKATGGIKAQGAGKALSKNWWAKRWNGVLESFNLGARLSRGRSYARSGQVLSVEIKSGSVTASVQGSRVKPYKIKLEIKPLTPDEWDRIIRHLSQEALYASRLLAGEMPADIEEVFKKAGLSLFPERSNDLKTDCSCPDWSNPCKHIAAVYYILGQEFDRDPFLIFKLRGLERDELLRRLTGAGEAVPVKKGEELGHGGRVENAKEAGGMGETGETGVPGAAALSPDPVTFWEGGMLLEDFLAGTALPPVRAALLQQLGEFPFWRGEESVFKALQPVYTRASEAGLKLAAGIADAHNCY